LAKCNADIATTTFFHAITTRAIMNIVDFTATVMYQFPHAPDGLVQDLAKRAVQRFMRDTELETDLLEIQLYANTDEYILDAPECRILHKVKAVRMLEGTKWILIPYTVVGNNKAIRLADSKLWDASNTGCVDSCGYPVVQVEYVWIATRSACDVPDKLIDQYGDEMLDLVRAYLYEMLEQPWSSTDLSKQYWDAYFAAVPLIKSRSGLAYEAKSLVDTLAYQFPDLPHALVVDALRRAKIRFLKDSGVAVDTLQLPLFPETDSYLLDVGLCRMVLAVKSVKALVGGCLKELPFKISNDFKLLTLIDAEKWSICPAGCERCGCDCQWPPAVVEYAYTMTASACDEPVRLLENYEAELLSISRVFLLDSIGTAESVALSGTLMADYQANIQLLLSRVPVQFEKKTLIDTLVYQFKDLPRTLVDDALRRAKIRFLKDSGVAVDTLQLPLFPETDSYLLDVGLCRMVLAVKSVKALVGGCLKELPFKVSNDFKLLTLIDTAKWSICPAGCERCGCDCQWPPAVVEYAYTMTASACDEPVQLLENYEAELLSVSRVFLLDSIGTSESSALSSALMKDYQDSIQLLLSRVAQQFEQKTLLDTLAYQFPDLPRALVDDALRRAKTQFLRDSELAIDTLQLPLFPESDSYLLDIGQCRTLKSVKTVKALMGGCQKDIPFRISRDNKVLTLVDPERWGICQKGCERCGCGCEWPPAVIEYAWTLSSSACEEPHEVFADYEADLLLISRAFVFDSVGSPDAAKLSGILMGEYQARLQKLQADTALPFEATSLDTALIYQFPDVPKSLIHDAVQRAIRRFLSETEAATDYMPLVLYKNTDEYLFELPTCRMLKRIISVEVMCNRLNNGVGGIARNWRKLEFVALGAMEGIKVFDQLLFARYGMSCSDGYGDDDGNCTMPVARIEYAYTITRDDCAVDDELLELYQEELLMLSRSFILDYAGKPWSSVQLAAQYLSQYALAVAAVKARVRKKYSPRATTMLAMPFFIKSGVRRSGRY
jgi:hypothetical protein